MAFDPSSAVLDEEAPARAVAFDPESAVEDTPVASFDASSAVEDTPSAAPVTQPVTSSPDTLSDDFTGLATNARIASIGLMQAGEMVRSSAMLSAVGRAKEQLAEQQRLGADPLRYLEQAGGKTREEEAQSVIESAGPTANAAATRIVQRSKDIAALQGKLSPEMQAWNAAHGMDAVRVFASNPVEIVGNLAITGAISSIPSIVGGAVGTVAGGIPGGAAGVGAGSFAVEYGNKIVDELSANGVDLTSPDSIQKAFANPELMERIRAKAVKRGVPVAAFDAASAGVAGKILGPVIGKGIRAIGGAIAKETGVQMLAGAAGESAGAIVAGDEPSPKAMFEEAVGELGGSAREVAQNVFTERNAQRLVAEGAPLTAEAVKNFKVPEIPTPEPPELPPTPPVVVPKVETPVVPTEPAPETKAPAEPVVTEAPVEIKPPRTFPTRPPHDTFGSETTPVASAIINDIGGIVSKSQAKKAGTYDRNGELWDDSPTLKHPTHNKVYNSKGEMPDAAAQTLFDAGLIADPSVGTMWKALAAESQTARTTAKEARTQVADAKLAQKQGTAFDKAAADKDSPAVEVKDLNIGDIVTVGDEPMKVTAIDPDTFDVTLEDGKKYGIQEVKDGEVIYGEHASAIAPTEDSDPLSPEGRPSVDASLDSGVAYSALSTAGFREKWLKLRETGASDEQIKTMLGHAFGLQGGGGITRHWGGTNPRVQWGYGDDAQTIKGKQLIEKIRSLFSIPEQGAAPLPTLRRGENQGDLLAKQQEDLTLVGEKGVDTIRQAEEKARAEREAAEAKAKQDAEQETMFGTAGAIGAGPSILTPAAPSAPIVPVKPMREIIRDLSEGLGLPIRFGRLTTSKFAGYFKKVQNLIGAKSPNDIEIVSHEVGHKLDDLTGMSKNVAIRAELDTLGDPATPGSRSSWTKSKSLKYKHGEGLAEFVRYWLIDPAHATAAAPNTERYFNLVLDSNPDFADVMRQAQEDVQNWRTAPAHARLDSSISIGDNPNRTRYTVSQLTRDVVDDLHMLRMAVDDAERISGSRLDPSNNPYMLARLLRGSYGMADTFIRSGTVDFQTKKVTLGTSLTDALKPVAGRIADFRRWIVAKRAQELRRQGKETGLVPSDVDVVAATFDADTAFQDAFTKLKAWSDSLLQYAVDSGYISAEHAENMRTLNEDYVPFHRIFEIGAGEDPSQTGGGAGRGLNVGQVGSMRRLSGSQRDIVDPLETLVKNAYAIITASEKSAINAAIAGLSQAKGMGKWVERVATPKESVRLTLEKIRDQLEAAGADTSALPDDLLLQFYQQSYRAPWGENIIKVSQSGETTFYRLKSDLFDAFHALDNEDSSRFIQILAAPAQWLRAGVTLSPDFALSNLMRDTFSSAVINKYGMVPFEAALRGMAAMIGNPTMVAEWAAAGGAQSIEANYFDRKKLSEFVRRRVTDDLTMGERALIIAKSPLTALRMLTGSLETVTRLGEYQKSYNQAVKGGMSPGEARRLAAYESRDRQDFAKGGAKTKILRHASAFWNAAVQANVKLAQSFRERPIRTMAQGLAFVTIPKLIEQAVNWDDDDYWDRPQWERDLFFMIPISKDRNGHTKFLRIPIPFEVGLIFGTVPGRMTQWAKQNRAQAMKGLPETILRQTIPNPIPQSVQVVIADFMTGKRGWDFFKMRPIVPETMADLPAELQWTEQTSLTARHVGAKLGFSPLKVDHIIRNTTGGLGQQITHNLIDRAIGLATGEKPTALNVAPGMRFFATPAGISSERVELFYTELSRLREAKAGSKMKGESMESQDARKLSAMEAAADEMSAMRKKARAAADQTEKQRIYLEIVDKSAGAME